MVGAPAAFRPALAEAFAAGVGYAEFVEGLPPAEALRFREVEADLAIDPASSPFHGLGPLRVLALSEGWCRDSADSLPILARLLESVPGIELRVVHRDAHMELMRWYLTDGNATIPVYVFADEGFGELARYMERPPAVSAIRRAERIRLAREDPRFRPATAKPKSYPEPIKSDLIAGINRLRAASRPVVSDLIETALADVAATIAHARRSGAEPVRGEPAPAIPISFVDDGVGGDECEVP